MNSKITTKIIMQNFGMTIPEYIEKWEENGKYTVGVLNTVTKYMPLPTIYNDAFHERTPYLKVTIRLTPVGETQPV